MKSFLTLLATLSRQNAHPSLHNAVEYFIKLIFFLHIISLMTGNMTDSIFLVLSTVSDAWEVLSKCRMSELYDRI